MLPSPPQKLLLCTDLDRTLLPNGSQPESPQARPLFAQIANREEVRLAYVTGRHKALVQEAIRSFDLPQPDWVIADVGSTIYEISGNQWMESQAWGEEIAQDWKGRVSQEIAPLLADLQELTLQEPSKQSSHKLSFYCPLTSTISVLLKELKGRLDAQQINASLIHSIDEESAVGLLDVLPARATKYHAIEFIMKQHGFTPDHTVFAGDSGNDLPVLVSRIPAILVANAHDEIIQQSQSLAQQMGTRGALYLAHGQFMGMNGHYAAGILEGLAHYHPGSVSWMAQPNQGDDASTMTLSSPDQAST